ncbi:helix-turn-helix domain-containing protein [Kitasatospora cineracea]|uniref:helix-turn-helix domain-containing protein n=1 Tax=Kitasatospora cineracea TaxID=88074 RepID=UPI0033CD5122
MSVKPNQAQNFIAGQRTAHGVPHTIACRALGVSESWFYKWRRRPTEPTARGVRRVELAERIRCFSPSPATRTARPGSRSTCGPRAGRCSRKRSP